MLQEEGRELTFHQEDGEEVSEPRDDAGRWLQQALGLGVAGEELEGGGKDMGPGARETGIRLKSGQCIELVDEGK
jgi:hypothetical protein